MISAARSLRGLKDRARRTEALATQAASQLARRSIVRQVRGPRTRSAAEAAKRSFVAEAAAGDLMIVEDGPAPRAQREGAGREDAVLAAVAA